MLSSKLRDLPRRLLMGPGPSESSERVRAAMALPTLGHLDPAVLELMDDVSELLRRTFRTENALTFAISGTGTAGMQATFTNLLEPGDLAIIGVHGYFGSRIADIAERLGARLVRVEAPWGEPIPVDRLLEAQRAHPDAKLLAVVHAETSTGVLQPIEELGAFLADTDTLFVVDTVTSLAGVPVAVDDWSIDVAFSATQKCLSVPPGLAPITVSGRALDRIRERETRIPSLYLDLSLLESYWATERRYHHTVSSNNLASLYEGLCELQEEGLEARHARHRRLGAKLQDELVNRGLDLAVEADYRLPQLTAVNVPAGVDDREARGRLLREFGIEIGGGLGPLAGKVWRIGLMGETCREENVTRFLNALDEVAAEVMG